MSGLDRRAQSLLRVAAAAGRDVSYPLLVAVTALPERGVHESLRAAVEHGVLVADQAGGRYRFRHALLAEAVYGTVLPGEREWLHARLADELACGDDAGPAELAPHWALAGRSADALTASVAAAREAQAVFGLSEARGHLERALALWDVVPDAVELTGLRLDELLERTAQLASQTGDAPRAVELTRQAIALVGASDRPRAAVLHERLGTYRRRAVHPASTARNRRWRGHGARPCSRAPAGGTRRACRSGWERGPAARRAAAARPAAAAP